MTTLLQVVHRLVSAVVLVAVAGCAAAPGETSVERAARLGADCAAAGFQKDSEAFRLCLLLQGQDERLAALERRLAFIEQDVRFDGFGGYRGRYPHWP